MASALDKAGFPILTSEEAVANCKSMFGVALSVEDLLRPQFQQMKRLYVAVLSSFGVPTEQFTQGFSYMYPIEGGNWVVSHNVLTENNGPVRWPLGSENHVQYIKNKICHWHTVHLVLFTTQPQFKFMDSFEHPELHEESAPLVILALALQRFMFACGVENFSIFDLVTPKPKRTLHCLSAIVNFTKFKGSREHVYDNAIAEVDKAVQQREMLMTRNKELSKKTLELKAKRAEEDQQVQKLEDEVQELQNSVSELNKQQAAEMKHIQQLKTSNAELSSKKAETKANLAGLKQDCDSLKSKIVQSPDRFKGELARLTSAVQSVREARDERSARLQEICTQQESSLQFTEDAQTALKMITGIGLDMDKLREETAKLEDFQDKIVTQKEVLRDLTAKIEQLRRQQASKQEKLSRLMRQHDKKVAATHDASGQLQREQALLEKKIAEKENYLEQCNNQLNSLSMMVKEEMEHHEEDMDKLHTVYQQLLGQLESYHHGLNRGWEKVITATNKQITNEV